MRTPPTRLTALLLACGVAWLAAACGGDTPSDVPRDDAYARATSFDVMGTLAGGQVRGRTIHADGRLTVWEADGRGDARRVTRTVTLSHDEVRRFFDRLRALGFRDQAAPEHDTAGGAFATGMALRGPDGDHELWWVEAKDAPAGLREIPQVFARWEHRGG